jgi:hypothetical protein
MSKPETLLALRKQMLLSRAALERAEMVRAVGSAAQSVQSLRHNIPGLALGAVGRNLPLVLSLVQRLRLLAPVLPVLLMVVRRPLLRYSVLGAAATVLLAFKSWGLIAMLFSKSGPEKR